MARVVEPINQLFQKIKTSKSFGQCMKNVQLLLAEDGKCKAQFVVAEEHLNVMGTLHGGFISTVIDCVSSYALTTKVPRSSVSVDLHVTFLKAAFPGDMVTVDAKTIRAGKNIAFLAVELTKNDGKDIIASGQHTKYLLS